MEDHQFSKDRRKCPRVLVPDWIYAVCQEAECTLARVADISTRGLAVHYIAVPGVDVDWPMTSVSLDLFESGSSRRLRGLEAKIVYNIDVPQPDSLLDNHQLRRCGYEFDKVSRDQHGALEAFIAGFQPGAAGDLISEVLSHRRR